MAGSQVRVGVGVSGAKAAASELDKLRDKFASLQKQGAKGFAIGAGAAVTTKAITAVGSAIGGVLGFLGDASQAYREDQVSVAALTTALYANVDGFNGNSDAIEKVIASRMKLGFSDDEQRSSLASLLGITHDATKALDVQRTAMDLARLRGLDLATATDLLGKVYGGNLGILARYGIVIDKNATSTEALATIQKMAGGQAQAYADTDLGRVDAANVKVEDSTEKIGKSLSKLGAEILPPLADAFVAVVDGLDAMTQSQAESLPATKAMVDENKGNQAGIEKVAHALSEQAYQTLHMADATKDDAIPALSDLSSTADEAKGPIGELAAGPIEKLRSKLKDAAAAAAGLDGSIGDLTGRVDDGTVKAGKLADAQANLNDILTKGPASQSAADLAIYNGKVAEARQRVDELQGQMAQDAGPVAFLAWLDKEEAKLSATDTKGRLLLETYRQLAKAQLALSLVNSSGSPDDRGSKPNTPTSTPKPATPTGGTPIKGARASGGHVEKGLPYLVGEDGKEVMVPDASGTIIPNDALAGGGPTVVIQGGVHLHGIGSDVSPQAARRFASSVLDAVGQGLREQNARTGRRRVA